MKITLKKVPDKKCQYYYIFFDTMMVVIVRGLIILNTTREEENSVSYPQHIIFLSENFFTLKHLFGQIFISHPCTLVKRNYK